MITEETLFELVERQIGPGPLDSALVRKILHENFGALESAEMWTLVDSAIREPLIEGPAMEWNPGGWKILVTDAVTKTVVCSGLLWGVLAACGLPAGIPSVVIPAVMTILFDLKKVKLTGGEKEVALHLFHAAESKNVAPAELYGRLDPGVREHLNYFDFLDLLEKLKEAGRANEKQGFWKILGPKDEKFRVTFE